MAAETGRNCSFHPKLSSLTTCASCGRRLCGDCIVATSVGFKCHECAGQVETDGGTGAVRLALYAVGAVVVVLATAASVARALLSPDPPARLGTATRVGDAAVSHDNIVLNTRKGETGTAVLDVPHLESSFPVAVIVPAWRAADPDGLIGGTTVVDPFYKDLADALTRQGIAVIRYGSTEGVQFNTRIRAARAAVQRARRVDQASGDVVLVGHEEGSLVAAFLASQRHVIALVLVSPPKSIPPNLSVEMDETPRDVRVLIVNSDEEQDAGPAPPRWLGAADDAEVLRVHGTGSTLARSTAAEGGRTERDAIALNRIARWIRGAIGQNSRESDGHSSSHMAP